MTEELRLEGTACRLRDWKLSDEERLRRLLAPEQTWHDTNGPYFGRPSASDMVRAGDGFMALAAQAPADLPEPRSSLAISDALSDHVIGCVSWYWECEETDWRRMGIVIYDEAARGRGVGREALSLWTTYLFASTDALRLDFATYSGNVGMTRVADALGFREEARLRAARRWSGGVHDSLVYGVLREEWERRP